MVGFADPFTHLFGKIDMSAPVSTRNFIPVSLSRMWSLRCSCSSSATAPIADELSRFPAVRVRVANYMGVHT